MNKSLFDENYLAILGIVGFAIGLYNMQLNEMQTDNDTLFKEIQQNEEKLDLQNEIYLEKIIKQNEEILALMKGGTK